MKTATTMIATDKANYVVALRHIKNKRKLEEKVKGSSQAIRDMTTSTPLP